AHDAELRVQERALGRELGWRGRGDPRPLMLEPPPRVLARRGPVAGDPRERAVWRVAAAELDGYRRAYGLDHDRPAKHAWGRVARDGRAAAPAPAPTGGAGGGPRRGGAPD